MAELDPRWHGWFGEPWPSGLCELTDEDGVPTGEWNWDLHITTPVGHPCGGCDEPIDVHDRGQAMPHIGERDGKPHSEVGYWHVECLLRGVLGPLAHLEKRCPCFGGPSNDTPGLTRRQEALAVWQWTFDRRSSR